MADIGDESAGCAPATSFMRECKPCAKEIDAHIARFERLKDQTTDKIFLAGVAELLKNYLAEKVALHPKEE